MNSEKSKPIINFTQKLNIFQSQIRKVDRLEKVRSLRQEIQLKEQIDINQMISRLPTSGRDLLDYIKFKKGFEKTISQLLMKYLREQLQSKQIYFDNLKIFVHSTSQDCLIEQIQLLYFLIQYQGDQSPILLQKYFDFFYQECLQFNKTFFLFNTLYLVTKNKKLNWAPVKYTIFLINSIQNKKDFVTSDEELKLYRVLSTNYASTIYKNIQIVHRIKQIVGNMDKLFVHWKTQIILSLFVSLTCLEPFELPFGQTTNFCILLWTSQMLRHLKLNIFYKSSEKIKLISLKLLDNLMLQNGSGSLWQNNKVPFAQFFSKQIKNNIQHNSRKIIVSMSKTFLLMITQVRYQSNLSNIFYECQIDVVELILYILEQSNEDKQIAQLVIFTLMFLVQNLQHQHQQKFLQRLLSQQIMLNIQKTAQGEKFIEKYLKKN